uniref:phage tail fiber protein n=1 Tax=Acetobacter sicerae TaxID=85325 RepID=UPI0030CB4394
MTGPAAVAMETAGGGYARQSIAFTSLGDGRRTLSVSQSCSFGYATTDWGSVTALALYADNTATSEPLVAWSVSPRTISVGQTYSVASEYLSLLIQREGFFSANDQIGTTESGTALIARQPVSISAGVMTPAMAGSTSTSGSDGDSLTLSQLNQVLSQLMQGLPTSDPGDGTSLWLNANLLSLSVKS